MSKHMGPNILHVWIAGLSHWNLNFNVSKDKQHFFGGVVFLFAHMPVRNIPMLSLRHIGIVTN